MSASPLPQLPAWHARSFYAQLLLVATVVAHVLQIDMDALVARIGLDTPDQLVDLAMTVMPWVFGLWAWLERRAPNYQLVFGRVRS